MKIPSLLLLLFSLGVLSCAKENCDDESDKPKTAPCVTIAQTTLWNTINFKSWGGPQSQPLFTIQFPADYTGPGIQYGFEGHTFTNKRADASVVFVYNYCSSLFCNPFGDALRQPEPDFITVEFKYMTPFNGTVTLDQKQSFCDGNGRVGVYYFKLTNTVAHGRLFWLDQGALKQAADIGYDAPRHQEILEVIKSIKKG